MDKVEAVRLALVQLGDVSAEELTAYLSREYGIQIEPRFVPLFKATVRDRANLEQTRRIARPAEPGSELVPAVPAT